MKKKKVNILIFYGEKSGARMPLITTPARAYIALACRASERGLAAMAGELHHDWPERIHGAGKAHLIHYLISAAAVKAILYSLSLSI